jgi:D-alanine-D-alanine ligase
MSAHETGRAGPPVAVLMGGPSAEHDVSLVSGRAIARALAARGHATQGWLIDLDGRWWRLPAEALDPALPATAYDEARSLGAEGPLGAAAALEALAGSDEPPVVFPALHGPFGEDGRVQALLESAGLDYCGSGPAASAVGMDKTLFKRICGAMELPVLPWIEIAALEMATDPLAVLQDAAAFAAELPDPRLVVKPSRMGSSIGISIVEHPHDADELEGAVREALRFDDLVLAEPYLDHPREFEVAVLGNRRDELAVYGPGEIFPGRRFYDFAAKYRSDASRTSLRPELETGLREDVRRISAEVFRAIGAADFARVDFLLSREEVLFVSEINTIPGFTPISLFPQLCAEGGLDFADVCVRIVELARARAAVRPARRLTRADLP